MIPANQIMQLSNRAFWDVDMSKLDYKAQADAIIVRVFERGSWEDILEVAAYYGNEKVKIALMNAPYLMQKTMLFASNLFKIPLSSFKCFTTKQYHPIL